MKTCSKCGVNQGLNCFQVNDYGRHKSNCNDCESKRSLMNYYKRKGIDTNEGLQTESEDLPMKKEIKCKSFFFYQHTL